MGVCKNPRRRGSLKWAPTSSLCYKTRITDRGGRSVQVGEKKSKIIKPWLPIGGAVVSENL